MQTRQIKDLFGKTGVRIVAAFALLSTVTSCATDVSSPSSNTSQSSTSEPGDSNRSIPSASATLTPPERISVTIQRERTTCTSYLIPGLPTDSNNLPNTSDDWSDWALSRDAAETWATKVLITVEGTTDEPVTITDLQFSVTSRSRPEPSFVISNECGSETVGRFAHVDLDQTPPAIDESSSVPRTWGDEEWRTTPLQFPYKITDVDSETILIIAQTQGYAEWHAKLSWTDGEATGVEIIDDDGTPFRTDVGQGNSYRDIGGKWGTPG